MKAPSIYVLAGTNGAGKSSIAGAKILREGGTYYDPDAEARSILSSNPRIAQETANSEAWKKGKDLPERAIEKGLNYAFETTLGGVTITKLLETAAVFKRVDVHIWYAGLASPELHIARVKARVSKGGHDVDEEKIRERYESSRRNLIRLLPNLAELRLYDNSKDADPDTGARPEPALLLHLARGEVVFSCDPALTPEWARAIFAAAGVR